MVEILPTGISNEKDFELFKKAKLVASKGGRDLTVSQFLAFPENFKSQLGKVDINKYADTMENIGTFGTIDKKINPFNTDTASYNYEKFMKDYGIDDESTLTNSFSNKVTSNNTAVLNENKMNFSLYNNYGNPDNRNTQVESDSYQGTDNTSISVAPSNKKITSVIGRIRNKLKDMGLKKESFDPATGKSMGLQDTDEMRGIVKPIVGAIFGGPGAILGSAVSMFAHGRAQKNAAIEMIKDINEGTFKPDNKYLIYSGKQLFRKMATTFADPEFQIKNIYKKSGVTQDSLTKFFDYAAKNDLFDNKTLRDIQKYQPTLFEEARKSFNRDITYDLDKDVLPFGPSIRDAQGNVRKAKLNELDSPAVVSEIVVNNKTVERKYKTPDGNVYSTGYQAGGITNSSNQPTTPASSNNTPKFSGNPFITRQEGGPINVSANQQENNQMTNLELVNEKGKDMSGVADDVPRDLSEGDFVINAPAVKIAGIKDIRKMIDEGITSLQKRGIKLDFGTVAEDIDKTFDTLVSNGEVIIPKVLAEEIGYDRLNKINNRGKEEVRELDEQRKEEIPQKPQPNTVRMAQSGGAVGSVLDSDVATGKLAAAGAPGEILSTPRGAFVNIAKPMPTAQVLQQTPIGEEILRPQTMNLGGEKIVPKEKPTITQFELVRNSLSSTPYKLRNEAIAGILGNIAVETGETFDYRTSQMGGPGRGLFQFEGGHSRAYEDYKKANNLSPSIGAQVSYVLDNIYKGIGYDIGIKNRKDLQNIFATGTTSEIAKSFAEIFERPNPEKAKYDKRIQRANEIFDMLYKPNPQKSFPLTMSKEEAFKDIDEAKPVIGTGLLN